MVISLKNKTVFITGASSGFGKACAEQFAAHGARVIITARRLDRLKDLSKELHKQYGAECLPLELDIQNQSQVKKTIHSLDSDWNQIDILINNAGLALGTDKMQDSSVDNWNTMIDTNLKGLLYATHAVLPGMIIRNHGHIVNVGSVAGSDCYPGGNVYSATKHAVKAISRSLRIDLLGTAIRVTEIAPGQAETEFSEVRWNDKEKAKQLYAGYTPLNANDIADAIIYAVTRPLHVDIAEMTIYPSYQASPHYVSKGPLAK